MVEGEILELQSELERRRSELMVLRDKRKVVSEIRAKKRVIARMLSVFSSLTPTTVTIRGVELTPTQIEVSGVARDVEAVRQWMKEIVAACGGYTPTLQQLRVVQFGRVRAHEFVAQIVRPQSLEKIEPCVTGEVSQGA
jgi:Tfp pilus assembly protein PilN